MMSNKKLDTSIQTHFIDALEEALKNFTNQSWLSAHSPLASPYFLGSWLQSKTGTVEECGVALQNLLKKGAEQIQGKNNERYQTILREYYFHNNSVEVISKLINVGRNQFHLSRRAAIDALQIELIELVRPSLRLETPPIPPSLIERQKELEKGISAIQAGQTVTILGTDGVGKTTLASCIMQESHLPAFWYPVRPGLTDSLESFAFAFGFFAHTNRESSLWLELVAARKEIPFDNLLHLTNYTLEQLPTKPVLYIDDIDILQPETKPEHNLLLQFWASLRIQMSIVVTGKNILLETDHYIPLSGLSFRGAKELYRSDMLSGEGVSSDEQITPYYAWTHGNPRLLRLCQAFSLEVSSNSQNQMGTSLTLDWLLAHVIDSLLPTEQKILAELCVFRRVVPLEIWRREHDIASLNKLIAQHLIQITAQNGIGLPQIVKQYVYHRISQGIQKTLHQKAAILRSTNGEYSATIYHLMQADLFQDALDVWSTYEQYELSQGQATNALNLYRQILQNNELPLNIRDQLHVICARLERFIGKSLQAIADLRLVSKSFPEIEIEALGLEGVIENDQDEFQKAEQAFSSALQKSYQLLEQQIVQLYKGRAWMYLYQKNLDRVDHELNLAQYELENMWGNLMFERSDYHAAVRHYEQALRIAKEVGSLDGQAKVYINLSGVLMYHGEFRQCFEYLEKASKYYQQMDKLRSLNGCRITTAVAYNLAGNYSAALLELDKAQGFYEQQGQGEKGSQLLFAQAKAEALLGLGDFDSALKYVQSVIVGNKINLLPDAYRVLGEIFTNQNKWDDALTYLQMAISLAQETENLYIAGYSWRSLGKYHAAKGESEQSLSAYHESISLFSAVNLPNEVKKSEELCNVSKEESN